MSDCIVLNKSEILIGMGMVWPVSVLTNGKGSQ